LAFPPMESCTGRAQGVSTVLLASVVPNCN
jgi:hypothetical protein